MQPRDGFALANIGTEWAIPTAVLLVGAISMFRWFHVAMVFQLTYFVTTMTWSFLMFSYLHDVRHVENFWLAGNRWLKHWFTSARGLHDIHHATINDQELMNKNFGIGFFVFDHIFGSFLSGNSLSTTGDTRPCGGFAR